METATKKQQVYIIMNHATNNNNRFPFTENSATHVAQTTVLLPVELKVPPTNLFAIAPWVEDSPVSICPQPHTHIAQRGRRENHITHSAHTHIKSVTLGSHYTEWSTLWPHSTQSYGVTQTCWMPTHVTNNGSTIPTHNWKLMQVYHTDNAKHQHTYK